MNTKETVKKIRKTIKAECKTISVRLVRGDYLFLAEISGSDNFGRFTQEENEAMMRLGFDDTNGCNLELIARDDKEIIARLTS